jgi:hypothetical protein
MFVPITLGFEISVQAHTVPKEDFEIFGHSAGLLSASKPPPLLSHTITEATNGTYNNDLHP